MRVIPGLLTRKQRWLASQPPIQYQGGATPAIARASLMIGRVARKLGTASSSRRAAALKAWDTRGRGRKK